MNQLYMLYGQEINIQLNLMLIVVQEQQQMLHVHMVLTVHLQIMDLVELDLHSKDGLKVLRELKNMIIRLLFQILQLQIMVL